MNSTEASNTTNASQHLAGFAISFGVSIAVLVLIIIIFIAAYLYSRKHIHADTSHQSTSSSDDQDSITIELGLNEATFHSYPKLLYSQAKLQKGDSIASCCSICLAGYENSDVLRLIPECEHLFHLKCIDQWLRQHTMCPICRSSPALPTETSPVATRRELFFGFIPFLH